MERSKLFRKENNMTRAQRDVLGSKPLMLNIEIVVELGTYRDIVTLRKWTSVGKLPAAVYNLLSARTVPHHSALFAVSLLQILGQAQ